MKQLLKKYPAPAHIMGIIIRSFITWLIILLIAMLVLFIVLQIIGVYAGIETALDLKYDSPIFTIALFGSLVLAIISLGVGLALFFHKYKRNITNTTFKKAFSVVLSEK